VVVEIADDGSGIPPEVQSHIFEPFYTTKGVGRNGLGLVISSRIVANRHNGEIEFSSAPGDTASKCAYRSSTLRNRVDGGKRRGVGKGWN